jgi:hypothetical protein
MLLIALCGITARAHAFGFAPPLGACDRPSRNAAPASAEAVRAVCLFVCVHAANPLPRASAMHGMHTMLLRPVAVKFTRPDAPARARIRTSPHRNAPRLQRRVRIDRRRARALHLALLEGRTSRLAPSSTKERVVPVGRRLCCINSPRAPKGRERGVERRRGRARKRAGGRARC